MMYEWVNDLVTKDQWSTVCEGDLVNNTYNNNTLIRDNNTDYCSSSVYPKTFLAPVVSSFVPSTAPVTSPNPSPALCSTYACCELSSSTDNCAMKNYQTEKSYLVEMKKLL